MNFATQDIRTAAARLVDLARELERLAELRAFIEDRRDVAKRFEFHEGLPHGVTLNVRITDLRYGNVNDYEVELPATHYVFDAILQHVEHQWAACAEIRALVENMNKSQNR